MRASAVVNCQSVEARAAFLRAGQRPENSGGGRGFFAYLVTAIRDVLQCSREVALAVVQRDHEEPAVQLRIEVRRLLRALRAEIA